MTIQTGGTIQGYELIERIGSGGFGAVYRAYQSTIGREVAIKVIHPSYANHPEFIRHFEREAQLISRLEHLHIVPLYDYWRDQEGAYIVMRWMKGGSLADALGGGPFDLEPARLLLDQVASGLVAAHSRHIIHCDLKPANIMLDEEGNAYLGDFNIAMDILGVDVSAGNRSDRPMAGKIGVGSPGYASPEQLRGQSTTPQSDIYSLGITLYEVLIGHHPFPSENSIEQLFKHVDEPLPTIESLDQEVLAEVNRVIQKATAKNPKQRYQDALAMAAAFRQAASLSKSDQAAEIVESLTLREQEILHLLVEGNTNKQIAQELYVELPTIKWHISNIYKKLGVRTRVQAILRARELDLIVSPASSDVESKDTPQSSFDHPEPINPYKGLRSFEPADKREFYGREAAIERLLDRLTASSPNSNKENGGKGRFLAIVGPSGSGKSSLVKAGLISALWSGRIPGSEKWFVVSMVPGARPLDNLETSLTRIAANQASNLRTHLDRDAFGLWRVANLVLPNDDSELILVIDQFEQIFTQVEDEKTRIHFLDLLEGAVSEPHSRVRVVITLRADFYDRPLQYPNFGRLVQKNVETLLPLSAEELERAIVNPAKQVGVSLEPGLAATIIEDVNYRPGNLPLLQYALTELFDQRVNHTLTSRVFSDIGGAGGALARRAEQLYQEQDFQGQEMIRQMFLRLMTVSEAQGIGLVEATVKTGTSRRVLHAELLSATIDPDRLDDIIDTYVDYRLLTLDHDPASRRPTVELAHEAIIHAWDRLQAWLEESASDLNMHRQLIRSADEWITSNMDESFLLRGARLNSFESWSRDTQLIFTSDEQDYLAASLTAREEREAVERQRQEEKSRLERRSNRRLKALVGIMALALVIAVGLTIAAISFSRRAEEQQIIAEEQQLIAEEQQLIAEEQQRIAESQQRLVVARELVSAAAANIELNPERSILLALKAAETTNQADGYILPEVERLLHKAIQADRIEITIPMAGLIAFNHDGKLLAIGDSNGALKLWETDTGQEIRELGGHYSLISGLSFSPNGRYLASSSFDLKVKIWDVVSGEQVAVIKDFNSQVNYVTFSPDGNLLAAVDQDGKVQAWEVNSVLENYTEESSPSGRVEPVFFKQAPAAAIDVSFSPDGEKIAIFVPSAGIILWDTASGEQLLEISGVTDLVSNIAFSPDGEILAGGSGDLGTAIWNIKTGEKITHFPEEAPITHVAFSEDGLTLATSAKNGRVSLWDMETYTRKVSFFGQSTGFNFLALSLDGKWVAVGNDPQSSSLWNVSPNSGREVLSISAHKGKVYEAVYNPAGTKIATTGEDGTLRVWDATTGELLHSLLAQRDWEHLPAFSPNGQILAGINPEGDITLWDVESGGEIATMTNDGPALSVVTFSSDGSRLAAGGLGGKAYIWDLTTNQKLATINNDEGLIINDLIFSPEGDYIFSFDWLGRAGSWKSDSGEHFSGEEPNLVCKATLWDADATANGRLQAVASFDGLAYIFRAVNQPGEEPRFAYAMGLIGHEGNVTGVALNEQGNLLATSGLDGTVRLWSVELGPEGGYQNSGEEISMLTDQSLPLEGVDFSPDGRFVVAPGEDGMVRVFVVGIEDLMELARARLSRDFTRQECREFLHLHTCIEE